MPGTERIWRALCLLGACWLVPCAQAELRLYAWERPPLVMRDAQGVARGLVPELLEAMFARAGLAYTVEFLPLQRALRQVQQDPQARSCVVLVERQQEREARFLWVGPLLISRLALYARADDALQLASLPQAKAWLILSHQGSGAGEYLQRMGLQVHYSNHEALNIGMLRHQRARLWATSRAVAEQGAGGLALREVLPFLTLMEDLACHPHLPDEQLQALRQALQALYAEGQVQALYRRHDVALH